LTNVLTNRMATINFYLHPKRDLQGDQLIILVVQHKGQKLNHSTGIKLSAKNWDKRHQRVKPQARFALNQNLLLNNLRDKAQNAILQLRMQGTEPTVANIRGVMFPQSEEVAKVLPSLNKFIESHRSSHSLGFLNKYNTLYTELEAIGGPEASGLHFTQLDATFMERYHHYLLEVKQNTNNTIAKKLGFLQAFLNWAAKNKLTIQNELPEIQLPPKRRAVHIALTRQELERLACLPLGELPKLERVRDVFCFGCYTGLRYSDIENLKPENVVELSREVGATTRGLRIHMVKTQDFLTVPLIPQALGLLEHYNYHLPVISNQKTNKFLKELGQLAGLDTPVQQVRFRGRERIENTLPKYELLTTHTARRTFATLSASGGMNLVILQRILGHANIKQTMEYIKEVEGAKITEMEKVWGGLDD